MEINRSNIHCDTVLNQICDALNEDINSSFCEEVQLHLQQCPHCHAYIDSLRQTVNFCRKLIDEEVPSSVDKHLWDILRLTKPK